MSAMTNAVYRLCEFRVQVVRESGSLGDDALCSPTDVAAWINAAGMLPDDGVEHFAMVALDSQNHPIGWFPTSTGTVSASLVDPKVIFRNALLAPGCASIILVHNHPSGEPAPSREDIRLTQQLVEAGKLLELRIHDHIIVGSGSGRWVSLAERGLVSKVHAFERQFAGTGASAGGARGDGRDRKG